VDAGSWLTVLIASLIGTGGATFVGAAIKGYLTLRAGARAREREVYADLRNELAEARDSLRWAEADRDFWRMLANRWGGQLARAGIDPKPSDPIPPSEVED